MSGRKDAVLIPEYELDRLRGQAARATTLAQANASLNAINARLNRSVNDAQNRITTLTNNLNQLNNTVRQNAQQSSAQITALRNRLQSEIQASNARLAAANSAMEAAIQQTREDVANAIATNNRKVEEVINGLDARVTQQIDDVNVRITQVASQMQNIAAAVDQVNQNDQDLLDMANEYLTMARALNADSANYRCELLLPGVFASVAASENGAARQCEIAQTNLGNAPSAQLQAYNAYRDALAFHEQIVLAEQMWTLRYEAAMRAVEAAEARIASSATITEEATKIPVEVDFWSDGTLSRLSAETSEVTSKKPSSLRALLVKEDERNNLSLGDLDGIAARAREIEEETLNTAAFALGAAVNCQNRLLTADSIKEDLLNSNGLVFENWGYQGNDPRGAVRVNLQNPHTGLRLAITQTPEVMEDGNIATHLEVEIVNPGPLNEETAHGLAADIQQTLQRRGIKAGLSTVPGCEDVHSGRPETGDINRWLQETATVVKPLHATQTKPTQNTATVVKPTQNTN